MSATRRTHSQSPVRSSSHRPIDCRPLRRKGTRLNQDLGPFDSHRVLPEGTGRRAAGDGTVVIEHASVARAEKELRARDPPHRTAQVRAVDRIGCELRDSFALRPKQHFQPPCLPTEQGPAR